MSSRRRRFDLPRWRRAAVLAAAVLAAAVLAHAAVAQDDEIRRHGIFIDSLDVSLVNVEVRATADGRPVTDLERDDFEIFDDGVAVEITNFYRVEAGRRVAAPGAEPVEPAPAGPQERSFLVVLVDQAFISPTSRKVVFRALAEKLDELMSDGTQVMLVAKQREVTIEQRPTSDRAEIDAGLARLARVATRDYATEVRMAIRQIEQATSLSEFVGAAAESARGETDTGLPDGDAMATFSLARSHSQETHFEVRHSLRVLKSFLGSLAGLPGRKAILYVCDRLPLRPGELVWNVWWDKFGADYGSDLGAASVDSVLREYDVGHEVKALIADANASRIAFYPIGASSASGLNPLSAESMTSAVTPGSFSLASEADDGLRLLAVDTGGQAAIGRANPDWLFDRLRQDLTHYYSLAYPSPHRGDGKTHRIVVRVKRAGVQVRYLSSYVDKSGEQQMEERTLAALMHGATDNPLDVRVTLGESEKQKDGRYLVPMEVRFPLANLVLLPQEETHVGKVSIQIIVRDAKGRTSDPIKILVPIEIPHRGLLQALSQTASYNTMLAMRSGEQTVAVGVHDDLGSTSSTVNVDVRVGGGRG